MNKLSKLILMLPLALAPLAGQAAPKGGSHAALAANFLFFNFSSCKIIK